MEQTLDLLYKFTQRRLQKRKFATNSNMVYATPKEQTTEESGAQIVAAAGQSRECDGLSKISPWMEAIRIIRLPVVGGHASKINDREVRLGRLDRSGFGESNAIGLPGEKSMLHWSLIFLVIALIAGAFGFTGLAGTAAVIAKILFVLFLVVWLVIFLIVRKAV